MDIRKTSLTPAEAVLNLGNFLNLVPEDAELHADIVEASIERVERYQKKYESPEFDSLVDHFIPSKLEKTFSYAARPPWRVGEGKDTGPDTMRAIGFGQSLNNAGWGAVHVYYDLAEFLGADPKTGEFPSEEAAQKAADLYLSSPRTQDVINRANFNLSLSDRDMGWKFAAAGTGHAISRDPQDEGTVTINGEKFDIRELVASTDKQLRANLQRAGEKGLDIDMSIAAIRSAAELTLKTKMLLKH